MDREKVYEFVEEADRGEIMELLDAVMNRFREVYEERELIVITLQRGTGRTEELDRIMELLKEEYKRIGW